jgi:hypothetical protein
MGCGCKNKQNQTANQTQQVQPQQQVKNPNIQESIKKVVEKYYTKKK